MLSIKDVVDRIRQTLIWPIVRPTEEYGVTMYERKLSELRRTQILDHAFASSAGSTRASLLGCVLMT
jgi:hypothetical protein